MSEQKVVSRGIAIALGVLSTLLVFCLAGTLVYFPMIINQRDTSIQALTAQKDLLGQWLDGNMSLLQAAVTERGSVEAKLDNPQYGLPGIQSNFSSVLAALNASQAKPVLNVETVAEDDPERDTGIMALGILPTGVPLGPKYQPGTDLIAHYKATITYNGIPVQPTYLFLQVLKKTVHTPVSKQFPGETLASELTDVSADFVMMVRPGAPGVEELDVYYVGPLDSEYVAEYTLVIACGLRVGTNIAWGISLQSLCILGWSMDPYATQSTVLPDGTRYYFWANPLGTFTSCDEAVLWQRMQLGLPIPSG